MELLDLIDEKFRKNIRVFTDEMRDIGDGEFLIRVEFDMTPYMANLPESVEKVSVDLGDYFAVVDGRIDNLDQERILEFIRLNGLDKKDTVNGFIQAEDACITVTLKGGLTISSSFQEGGDVWLGFPELTKQ